MFFLHYLSHPSQNHLNHHHQYRATTTFTPTTIIIVVIVITSSTIHLLTPLTTHGSDLIHSLHHKSSPLINDDEVSNAMPVTHPPPLFTCHTYRTSTTATSINNNDFYSDANRKRGQKYADRVNIVNRPGANGNGAANGGW